MEKTILLFLVVFAIVAIASGDDEGVHGHSEIREAQGTEGSSGAYMDENLKLALKIAGGLLYPPAGIGIGIYELFKYTSGEKDTTTTPPPTEPPADFSNVVIPGVTDDPNRLVTVHSYQKGVRDPNAVCTLPDEHGLGMLDKKTLNIGESVDSSECKTYTCLRVYETEEFDLAVVSDYFGCWFKSNCYLVGSSFRDDRCYLRSCEIVRSKADGKVRSNIKFLSTVPSCLKADGSCVPPGTKYFDCFLNGNYESHCYCKKKGSIVFLDSLMRFGKKIPTTGGNANGTYCFFNFKADGETHNDCILGNRTQEWCAVTADYDKDKKWGYCTEAARYRYTKEDTKCALPFKYNGVLYHDCTKVDSPNGQPWCSTKFVTEKKVECDLSME